MTYQRLAYDDAATPTQMTADCRMVRALLRPVPSIRYEDYPREVTKPALEVDDTARRLASALHLHLD